MSADQFPSQPIKVGSERTEPVAIRKLVSRSGSILHEWAAAVPDADPLPSIAVIQKTPQTQPGSSHKKQSPKLHVYSRDLARDLNPEQHDITGAVVLYNLSLWQNNNFHQTRIDDKRHCFRSLSDLQEDHPYFTKSAIHKALLRLEKKLKGEFLIRRDKNKLWFHIGDKTREQQKKATLNSFYIEDAIGTKSVRSAVLLANLKYALSVFTDPKRDQNGNRYVELSPKKLCPILNYSEDTIARALKEMCKSEHLVRHSQCPSFYALADGFVFRKSVPKIDKSPSAEVHSQPAEVHNEPAEVHSETAEVHRYEGTDINEDVNECLNEDLKGSIQTSSAPPRGLPSSSSKGLTFLQKLLSDKRVSNQNSKGQKDLPIHKISRVHALHLPYDYIADNFDLPYDQMPSGNISFHERVKDQVSDMRMFWKEDHQNLDKDDALKLKRLFIDNPNIDAEELYGLYSSMIGTSVCLGDSKNVERESLRFLDKVKTPKAFLKYLPQIVVQSFQSYDEDFNFEGELYEPWDTFNYAYLGKAPNSKIVSLDSGDVPKLYIDEAFCPCSIDVHESPSRISNNYSAAVSINLKNLMISITY